MALHLKNSGRKVFYNSFDHTPDHQLLKSLDIPYLDLDIVDSAKTYMGKKLKSQTIASWIMKTPFFHSLFNMIPGLGMMILLGQIIELLEDDPELTIVLDSPASGHALTMFESSHNFRDMFKTGLIVDDIDRMHRFIYGEGILKTVIACLPTQMALTEGTELLESLKELKIEDIQLVSNDNYHLTPGVSDSSEKDLPNFLIKKVELEKEVSAKLNLQDNLLLAHIPTIHKKEVIEALSPSMEGLL
jgi:hypothetical protein